MRPGRAAPMTPTDAVERNHAKILAGNVQFGTNNTDPSKNIFGWHAQNIVTPATANTEFSVPHSLQFSSGGPAVPYTPIRFRVTRINANATVYDSGTVWTTSQIFLKCSVASATISLFID